MREVFPSAVSGDAPRAIPSLLRRCRTILASTLTAALVLQNFAYAACPPTLPITGFTPGNWAGPGTFTAPAGAIFIHDNSTVENGFPTNGGHWWVADGGTALCRMSLDIGGHWEIPPGLPPNLCSSFRDVAGQFDYDAARQYIYAPGRKTSVWRLKLAEAADGSGKEIVASVEVRPKTLPLPEGSGFDALTLNDGGSIFYVVSRNNPNVWACINPSDPTLATTRCKQIANGVDGKKMTSVSYNHTTHSLFLGETISLSEISNVDACFALAALCAAHVSQIELSALVLRPHALVSFGRYLYVADEIGRVIQADLNTNRLADPNAGRNRIYAVGMGAFPTGIGLDPIDGIQVFVDPGLPRAAAQAEVTRLPLCPPLP